MADAAMLARAPPMAIGSWATTGSAPTCAPVLAAGWRRIPAKADAISTYGAGQNCAIKDMGIEKVRPMLPKMTLRTPQGDIRLDD